MIVSSIVQGAMAYGQGQSNASSIRSAGKIAQMQSDFQSELLETRKTEILAQGDVEAYERQQQLKQMLGSQKVAFAAQGIEVEGDLGYDLAEDAKRTSDADVKAIKNNAWKQSMGIEMDQADLALQSQYNNIQAESRANDAYSKGVSGAIQGGVNAFSTFSKNPGAFRSGSKSIPTKNKSYTSNYKKGSLTERLA